MNDFAPGIPEGRQILPLPSFEGIWQLSIQEHIADRSGPHWDLRLSDGGGRAHSWAIPRRDWPESGSVRLAIQQPTHRSEYASWQGSIPSGYGAGEVRLIKNTPVPVKITPDRVEFTDKEIGTIVMHRRDGYNWIMVRPNIQKTSALQEIVENIRLEKRAEIEAAGKPPIRIDSVGELASGGLVGAGAGAIVGKGLKGKAWGTAIGAGIGMGVSRGAVRPPKTYSSTNARPSYIKPIPQQ